MTVVAVVKERKTGERRVALSAEVAKKLQGLGLSLQAETGLGEELGLVMDGVSHAAREEVLKNADILLTVQPPEPEDLALLKPGAVVIGFMAPFGTTERFVTCCDYRLTAFSVELIPRISRAQSMDALSSQASVAGYRGALIAAQLSGKFFPMLTTAAGTIRPAKVLVIGAGVAGLQAIATARRLGALVQAYDVRAAAREQVESLGAKFIDTGVSADGAGGYARELTEDEKLRQQAALAEAVAKSDAVIATAAIPGRPSPKIISASMVEAMPGGAVIVDLAAEGGGNCALTRPGETYHHHSITIAGPLNVASSLPQHASEMYAKNLLNFLQLLIKDGSIVIDLEDQILKDALLTMDGAITNENLAKRLQGDAP